MGVYTDSVASRLDRIEQKLDRLLAKRGAPSPSDRFVSVSELTDRLGVSVSTVYKMMADGILTRPQKVTPGRVGWPAHYIEEWLESRT